MEKININELLWRKMLEQKSFQKSKMFQFVYNLEIELIYEEFLANIVNWLNNLAYCQI